MPTDNCDNSHYSIFDSIKNTVHPAYASSISGADVVYSFKSKGIFSNSLEVFEEGVEVFIGPGFSELQEALLMNADEIFFSLIG